MKGPSPAFSFYPKDWLADANVKAMTFEERGVYVELLALYWLEDGLPAAPARLARLLQMGSRRFERLWRAIAPCFRVEGDRLLQKRVEEEKVKQVAYRHSQAEKGKRGGRPKSIKADAKPVISRGFSDGKPPQSLPSPSPSPSPYPENERTEAASIPANPLVGDRVARERQLLAYVQREAELTNRDGAEVMSEVTSYHGAKTSKLNPASMSDDRLLNSILDARARVKRLEEKAAVHGGP